MTKNKVLAMCLVVVALIIAHQLLYNQVLKDFFMLSWANYYHDQKQYDKAVDAYQRVIETNPNDGDAYWGLGTAYHDMGDYKNARRQVERLRKIGNKDAAERLEHLFIQAAEPFQYSGENLPGR